MSVVDILGEIKDARKDDGVCTFNGYVEDYLNTLADDAPLKSLLERIFELDENARICTDFVFNINEKAISNQIIRYKDSIKLPKNYMTIPVILYSKGITDFAYLLNQATGADDYLYAKGRYYILTEQYGLFESYRNDVLCDILYDEDHIVDTVEALLAGQKRIGALQRELDRKFVGDYDALKAKAFALAESEKSKITETFTTSHVNRAPMIHEAIEHWYLLKKCLYVQTMSNKTLLNDVNQGNLKLQRQCAKQVSDELSFIPLSEMWRIS